MSVHVPSLNFRSGFLKLKYSGFILFFYSTTTLAQCSWQNTGDTCSAVTLLSAKEAFYKAGGRRVTSFFGTIRDIALGFIAVKHLKDKSLLKKIF